MPAYNPGDLVLFTLELTGGTADHVATIREPVELDGGIGWIVHTPNGAPYYATADKLIPIPAGTPAFSLGEPVRVHDGAPLYAGRAGTVATPAFEDGRFGYWLRLGTALEWVPAVALDRIKAVGPR